MVPEACWFLTVTRLQRTRMPAGGGWSLQVSCANIAEQRLPLDEGAETRPGRNLASGAACFAVLAGGAVGRHTRDVTSCLVLALLETCSQESHRATARTQPLLQAAAARLTEQREC